MNKVTFSQVQLLKTKFFIPSPSHTLITRPHLTAQLSASLHHKLTLISAPAGFGKTTLLSDWVQTQSLDIPYVAWVSLDEEDNDPMRFWEYALTALNNCQSELFTHLLPFFHTGQSPSVHSFLKALINTLVEQTEQFVLILDDYHVITELKVHTSLNFLLEHMPSQLHIILASRVDLPLSLSRLRVGNQVFEVLADQLRCTREEVLAFFTRTMGIALTSEECKQVQSHTEGWITGLQLIALSMRGCTDPATLLHKLHGSQRYILDYLTDEVLRQQSTDLQAFLLRTSILERLCAPLCDRVMGHSGSQNLLEQLDQANLFIVSLDERHQWYRYHALFSEALRCRLEQMEGEAVSTLHLRASEWYAEQGNLHEAIRYAVSARDWQRAADLIEPVHAIIWSSSEHAKLRRWLEQLPVEVVRSRPRLCLVYARILFLVAPYTAIDSWLYHAERAARAMLSAQTNGTAETAALLPSERQEWDNLLGEIFSYRAAITAFDLGEGHTSLAYCQKARAHLSEQNLLAQAEVAYARSQAYYALGDSVAAIQSTKKAVALAQAAENLSTIVTYMCRTAFSLRLHGKLREVVEVAQQAALMGTTPAGLPYTMVSWAYIISADVLQEWNRLDEALELIVMAVQVSEQTETIVALYLAYTVLMRVYLARGEMEAARSAFDQAEATLAKSYSPYRRDVFLIDDWVKFWLVSGEVKRAIHWAGELAEGDSVSSPLALERKKVARARVSLAQNKSAEALSLLEPLQVEAQKQERWSHVIETKVLQALAHQMRAEEQEALLVLAQALQLAEPEGYIRIFVDEGDQMAALLSRLKEQERRHGPTPYLDTVLAGFLQDKMAHMCQPERTRQCTMPQPLQDPLSERELGVLQLIEHGATNQEIAEELTISVDTVKRHVYNIFPKLGVKNRVQAVARARTLGLLF